MIQLRITLPSACRTKKTGSIIIAKPFPRLVPGAPYRKWFDSIMDFGPLIREQLAEDGVKLPLACNVQVCALIYRDAERGDLIGYLESIADALQAEAWSQDKSAEPERVGRGGKRIPAKPARKARKIRDGLGIIVNDSAIVSWDGSRLLIDRDNPRVELTITQMEGAVQEALDLGEPEAIEQEAF